MALLNNKIMNTEKSKVRLDKLSKEEVYIYNWLKQFNNVIFINEDIIYTFIVNVHLIYVTEEFDKSNYLTGEVLSGIKENLKKEIIKAEKNNELFVIRFDYNGGLFFLNDIDYTPTKSWRNPNTGVSTGPISKYPITHVLMRYKRTHNI
jgi:hypothetical protein